MRAAAPLVLPSLLLCDFGNLEREIGRLADAGVQALHLDVMDGRFVPNFTYGMPIVAAVRRLTGMFLDVHLMIEQPERYVDAFVDAGADLLTLHAEALADPRAVLTHLRRNGVGTGLALNPSTPLEQIEPALDLCDLVLVMSVDAGFGGQTFNSVALEKLHRLSSVAPEVIREVDGGINRSTIRDCAVAGASWFVVGSAIFRQSDYGPVVRELTEQASVAACS